MEFFNNKSKGIFKTEEDTCKKFTAECLQGDAIHAIDIDTLYHIDGGWVIFEYLKCDSRFVNPYTSDPSKYVFNWRKFCSLWEITKALKGTLFLINYADKEEYKDMVRVMKVKEMDEKMFKVFEKMTYLQLKNYKTPYITYEEDMKLTKEQFSIWLRKLNAEAGKR